jgi:hypothetical protein
MMPKIKNRISITCDNSCFEADVLLEQKSVFHNCANCGGDGRQTFITIKELVNMALMEFVSTRSRIGAAIKRILVKKFDGQYFCTECAEKKWEIKIYSSA